MLQKSFTPQIVGKQLVTYNFVTFSYTYLRSFDKKSHHCQTCFFLLPRSIVFMITDATAQDPELESRVIALAMIKKIRVRRSCLQIVFLISFICYPSQTEGSAFYWRCLFMLIFSTRFGRISITNL